MPRGARALPVLLLLLPLASPARAQKLDKDDKKFLEDVKPILLPEEEKTYKGLKDRADRLEFQKIFWARRDPDLETPDNAYRSEYEKSKEEADAAYKVAGRPGSQNDCGRLFIILGKPDEVKKEASSESPGLRARETWTYRDRPGVTFAGGQIQVALNEECLLPEGDFVKQLDRVAANRVLHPNIDYRVGKDGKLTRLADLMPKPSPARALLKEPRQDFSLQSQALFLKVQDGGTAVITVARGDAAGLATEDVGGKKVLKLVLAGSAVDEAGKEVATVERKTVADVAPDGTFAASFRMSLRPGRYKMNAAALDEKGAKGSVSSITMEVPEYGGELGLASLIVLRDVHDLPASGPNPDSPFAPFQLGSVELVPYGTTTLTKADSPSFFYQVYDLKVDEATGKASGSASLSISKGTKMVAQAPPQPLDTPIAGSVIGPVPLAGYEPGEYKVQLKIADNVAKTDKVQEVTIEIKP
jgi:GWxTD domain-containing protein